MVRPALRNGRPDAQDQSNHQFQGKGEEAFKAVAFAPKVTYAHLRTEDLIRWRAEMKLLHPSHLTHPKHPDTFVP